MSVAQVAVSVQVPVPLFIVTVVPLIEQVAAGVAVIVGVMPEFCVVATVNVDKYAAYSGAPVKVTFGATFVTVLTAVTVSVACGAAA